MDDAVARWAASPSPALAAEVFGALVDGELLLPVRARVVSDQTAPATGLHAEKEAELDIVTVELADGRRVLPGFTSADRMRRWRIDARPVRSAVRDACRAVLDEGWAGIVVDPSTHDFVIGVPAVRALAEGFVPAAGDESVSVGAVIGADLLPLEVAAAPDALVAALRRALAREPVVGEAWLLRAEPTLDVGLALRVPLDAAGLATIAQRVAGRLAGVPGAQRLSLAALDPATAAEVASARRGSRPDTAPHLVLVFVGDQSVRTSTDLQAEISSPTCAASRPTGLVRRPSRCLTASGLVLAPPSRPRPVRERPADEPRLRAGLFAFRARSGRAPPLFSSYEEAPSAPSPASTTGSGSPRCASSGPNGEQVGIVRIERRAAAGPGSRPRPRRGRAQARPPVCKLMDYGKFKYENAQKAREARRNQAHTVIKEMKLRPKIDPHDYETKKGHVVRFLKAGDKVKVTIMFRGREQSRPELGLPAAAAAGRRRRGARLRRDQRQAGRPQHDHGHGAAPRVKELAAKSRPVKKLKDDEDEYAARRRGRRSFDSDRHRRGHRRAQTVEAVDETA